MISSLKEVRRLLSDTEEREQISYATNEEGEDQRNLAILLGIQR